MTSFDNATKSASRGNKPKSDKRSKRNKGCENAKRAKRDRERNTAPGLARVDTPDPEIAAMLERGSRLLGPAYRLFYDDPVAVCRGQGVWLYDRHGNDYLDSYNNVVSVGHAHPRVVGAISAQSGRLNTHTRYIQREILDYADQLLGTSGFSRSGEKMWGYQRHGLDPDIITMGKPMGNGYPVAGIGVAAEVVAAFGHDIRYFNTFGGNAVAMAAAQATLDVIQYEGLLAHAHRVGECIHSGLHDLAKQYDQIGDIRVCGMYWGMELVSDRETTAPDSAGAAAVVNGLRQRRVLISATGRHDNVLKIRSPLVFSEDHAERLLTEMAAVFAQW